MNTERQSVRAEWRAGWTLVLAASMGFSFFSIMLAGVALFIGPLEEEFGWSRTLLSAGPAIATITTAVLSPFFGALIDKFGSRRIAIPGIVVTSLSICAFALVSGAEWQWLALWTLFGLVAVSIKSTVWTAAVLGVFDRSRGLALGLTLAGTALAQIIIPPLGNTLIEAFGWRATFVWLGLGWGGLTLVLCLLFLYDARDRLARERKTEPAAVGNMLTGLSRQQAWRDSALWRLGISNFIVMALTQGLTIHLIVILTDAGVTRGEAAWLVSLSGIAAIVGKLVTGWLLDRFRPNWTGALILGSATITFAALMDGLRSPTLIVVALVVNGFAGGSKTQITGFLTAAYGGMKNFGAIYGTMAALMAAAAGIGPLIAGRIYDTTGNYELFLLLGAIGCAIGAVLIFTLPRYPNFESAEVVVDEGDAGTVVKPA